MTFLDLFTKKHIHNVLKRTFLYSNESEILFSAEKCKNNKNFTFLSVKVGDVERRYVLVKIPENLNNKEHQLKNSKVLNPVFIIENNNKEPYGAFDNQHEIERFLSPEQNNVECLKIILKSFVEIHALDLVNGKEDKKENPSKYTIKDITDTVVSLDIFKDLNTAIIKETIEGLQSDTNKILCHNSLLVRSVGCPFAKNIYINRDTNKIIFFTLSSTEMVPPIHDALVYIFALSNEKFRQEHFESLVLYYFELLVTFLHELQSNVADKITKNYTEHQVKVMLPVVKFKLANSLLKLKESLKLQEILTNIRSFLKYPLINQEDIYEASNSKFESSNYDLVSYSLVRLNEKNGHLGEYYHLNIIIKAQGEEKELQLFAKFVKPPTKRAQKHIENGFAKKEDFFYKTLIPLCSKYGLDNLLDFAPQCYLSRVNWLLVLDDLSRQGYIGFKPNVVLNYDGLRAAVESLAKFHACTIVLEEILSEKSKKPVRLDEAYGEFLEDTVMVYKEGLPSKSMAEAFLNILYYIVEKFPQSIKKLNGSPEEIRAQIKNVFLSTFLRIRKSNTIRNVVHHGDTYIANMLFKFGEDKLIKKGILIDFQVLRYGPPTYELLFLLFENSVKETRDEFLKILIQDYYQFITENIRKFQFNPEVIFPKELFEQDINFMMSAGIMGAFMHAHVMHIDPEFREEIAHDEEKFKYYFQEHKTELVDLSLKHEHYRNILKGLTEDLVNVLINKV